jgi:hypothetical protein
MTKLQVVLVEWMGYPLYRRKKLGRNIMYCGLGNLLKNMKKYDAGVDFECSVVINKFQNLKANSFIQLIDRIPAFQPLLLNNTQTNSQQKYEKFLKNYSFIKQCFYRDNHYQDIGAYDYFYTYLRQQKYTGHILFMNSSVRGPKEDGWLLKYKKLFEMEPNTGLCGISLNSHYTCKGFDLFYPHVQSFFLYTSMNVLQQVFPNGWLDEESILEKKELILKGEIGISTQILKAGFGIRSSIFPDFFYTNGQEWTIPKRDIRFQEEYYSKANVC